MALDRPSGPPRENSPKVSGGIDADRQWSNFEISLAATIEDLGEHDFLIVRYPWSDYFVQLAGAGDEGIYHEAASNACIAGIGRLLGPSELDRLAELGWAPPENQESDPQESPSATRSPNYSRLSPPPVDWRAVAHTAVETLRDVYHIGYPGTLRYQARDGTVLRFPALGLKVDGEPDHPPTRPFPSEAASQQDLQVQEQTGGGRSDVLVYRVREDGNGVVFASEERALEIHEIHHAMLHASTWADFKAMMPPDEYEEVRAAIETERLEAAPSANEVFATGWIPRDDNGDYPAWVTQEILDTSWTWGDFRRQTPPAAYAEVVRAYLEEEIPLGDDDPLLLGSFSNAYTNGDYPAWLQQEMLSWFPEDITEKFGGTEEDSIFNGPFLLLPAERADEIADALRKEGETVEHRPDLNFY